MTQKIKLICWHKFKRIGEDKKQCSKCGQIEKKNFCKGGIHCDCNDNYRDFYWYVIKRGSYLF